MTKLHVIYSNYRSCTFQNLLCTPKIIVERTSVASAFVTQNNNCSSLVYAENNELCWAYTSSMYIVSKKLCLLPLLLLCSFKTDMGVDRAPKTFVVDHMSIVAMYITQHIPFTCTQKNYRFCCTCMSQIYRICKKLVCRSVTVVELQKAT
uniref:Uncharacterized protein n=1 Tax=Opuntia streptacantha TaxID=393608 RepID=A0A7C8YI18_OPUST